VKTVGIVACSDAQRESWRAQNGELVTFLEGTGRRVLVSGHIYEKDGPFSGTGEERAQELMALFSHPDVEEIYDISGGDMANEVLPYLDFEAIGESRAVFWGYSDLTVLLNGIYARTGKAGVLYQVKNMVYGDHQALQRRRFLDREVLFSPAFRLLQGERMEGIVVGGNIRCFLKLAGTPYFPDVTGKLLLLESLGGRLPQMVTYLSQLRDCGVFEKISGILLGTFTKLEAEGGTPDMPALVRSFVGADMPVAQTREIGHGSDSKAIWIGRELSLTREEPLT